MKRDKKENICAALKQQTFSTEEGKKKNTEHTKEKNWKNKKKTGGGRQGSQKPNNKEGKGGTAAPLRV